MGQDVTGYCPNLRHVRGKRNPCIHKYEKSISVIANVGRVVCNMPHALANSGDGIPAGLRPITVKICAKASATKEPDAGKPHVRVCAGGAPGNRRSYRESLDKK